MATWQERLFELVRMGDGYIACKGGTGTLVELAVVWEIALTEEGDGCSANSIIAWRFLAGADPHGTALREVERGHASKWGGSDDPLSCISPPPPGRLAQFIAARQELLGRHQEAV